MRRSRLSVMASFLGLILPLAAVPVAAQDHGPAHGGEELGQIQFPVSCDAEAQASFGRGLALLHHMMYEEARSAFSAAQADPDCAMARWGEAMTLFQPLWVGQPAPEVLERGWALVQEAGSLGAGTDRERAYVRALEAFFQDPSGRDYRSRLAAWEQAQEAVFRSYPDDPEAAAFYALSHLATAPASDKTLSHQKEAAEILADVLARMPEHPGAIHYSIHAYDNVGLAGGAVDLARGYDDIAPSVPHALHMPTHIFVRKGLWPDVVYWNRRSSDAALKFPAGEQTSHHYAHALDYLAYAYLQRGEDAQAKAVLDELLADQNPQRTLISAYAYAATPARYFLEQHDWAGAAGLQARLPAALPWDASGGAEAITHFARGIGAARSGELAAAREALARLAALKTAAASDAYWAEQIEIQRLALAGWIALGEGDGPAARRLARESAEREAATEKHPVTPGAVVPAYELLGDLLLELHEPAAALRAYVASLESAPKRFNSLYGAARAAELAGEPGTARRYRLELLEVTEGAQSDRPRLREMRAGVS